MAEIPLELKVLLTPTEGRAEEPGFYLLRSTRSREFSVAYFYWDEDDTGERSLTYSDKTTARMPGWRERRVLVEDDEDEFHEEGSEILGRLSIGELPL